MPKTASTQPEPGDVSGSLAVIAERRDRGASVPALFAYRETRPCTARNCSADDLHMLVATSGQEYLGRPEVAPHRV